LILAFQVLYITKGGDVKLKRGQAVNGVANHRAIGFYLGDDFLSDMRKYMSHAPDDLAAVQRDGLHIAGCHVNNKFWLGGDLKFSQQCWPSPETRPYPHAHFVLFATARTSKSYISPKNN
jgi:hypothetical protein